MKEDKIIMYDSHEAGRKVTVSVWEVDNPNGIIYTNNEHTARWNNCTHIACECGGIREKSYTVCIACRIIKQHERYMALPFKEWDLKEPVVESGGDRYFFDVEDLEDYMFDNEMEEIYLLICDPIYHSQISSENVAGDSHDDYEPPKPLQEKIKEFNEFIKTLPPHSWQPGKVRTSHKMPKEQEPERSVATKSLKEQKAG